MILRRGGLGPRRRAVLVAVIVTAFTLFGSVRTASAHAVLESSSPSDQAVLDTPPSMVTLTFDENVSFTPAGVRVYDGTGKRVDLGNVKYGATRRSVTVGVRSDTADGSFVVSWKLLSADTHPIHGGIIYSVGAPSYVPGLDHLVAGGDDPAWVVAGQALRRWAYLGLFLAVGGAMFLAFVGDHRDRRRGLRVGVAVAGVVGVALTVAQLPQNAALATGLGAGSLFDPGVLGQMLGAGVAWTQVATVLAAVAAVVSVTRDSARARRTTALAALALLAMASAASGHSRTGSRVAAATLLTFVHAAGAATWVGIVLHATWSFTRRRPELDVDQSPDAVLVVQRLSRLATVALGAVAVSGAVLTFREVGSIEGITSTTYGRVLGVKVLIVLFVVAVAAFNHFRLVPALGQGAPPAAAWRYLRRSLSIETVGLVAVVWLTAILVALVPARTVIDASRIVSTSVRMGDGSVNVVVDPASTGRTALHLYLLDTVGRVDDSAESVVMRSTLPTRDIGPIERPLRRIGPGHYMADGTLFPVAGTWTVEMVVRVDEFTDRDAMISVKVRS